ncbi:HalOD1 output domain-containing protein [Natrinema sp. 1APR25-10V2]|uniref:HalOD1 output domain-containing protein n=1 Tax=Natrinema sp. 1APR25-10V2 TaxID=2951081 RepID=UPI002875554E|nr:HalOD1 output domain-containing protein [Natrinema sp. 1APR25-10V2]MDS0475451.1 hypothetical protein [Natrinema sp. 1APR25-10V2]
MIDTAPSQPSSPEYATICETVVSEAASTVDASPVEIPPLYHAIDPDALEALFDGREDTAGRVEFTYLGRRVDVRSTGAVTVSPNGDDRGEPDGRAHEWHRDSPICPSLVEAVTAETGAEPTSMDPLYDAVDPEALERVLNPPPPGKEGASAVEFRYCECDVSVTATGTIYVDSVTETPSV